MESWLAQGDGEMLELRLLPDHEDLKQALAKTVIAFANSQGGTVPLGAEGTTVVGAPGEQVSAMLMDLVRGRTRPSVDVDIVALEMKRKRLYAIKVQRSRSRPHVLASNGVPYVRRGKATVMATPEDLRHIR